MYPFGRTGSGLSGKSVKAKLARRRTTDSFQKQSLQNEEENKPKVYQGSYGVYNGLTWEQLKDFLENRFEGWTFDKVEIRDYWLFETPEPLSEDDHKALRELRDKATKSGRRPSMSDDEEQ
ncbi:hypothetical protein MMC10_010301 [Thelotrema lepadinum]|nr:hypothetical protein [Thelotrema lepadinum]